MISCVMSIYGFYSTDLVLRRPETSATDKHTSQHLNISTYITTPPPITTSSSHHLNISTSQHISPPHHLNISPPHHLTTST